MANHSFNTLAKKLKSTETHDHLAQPQPQLESDLKQYQRRQIYGRPIQNTSSAASHIIPPQIYDVAFFTLRVVVARVNPASATPITHLLRNELDDFQICELIRDLCGNGGSKSAKKAHTVAQPRLDPNRGNALRTKIEQARALHAKKLGDEDMVDVDIIYKCSHYQVEPFRSDMGTLAAKGARPYHMYPFREHEKEMALSVIVAPDVLADVYPPERCAAERIFIKTNTAPTTPATLSAAVPKSLEVAGEGTIFPNWHPALATVTSKDGLSRVCSTTGLRGRSSSVQEVVHSSSQLPMRTFSSSTDMDAREAKGEAPFQNDPGFFEEQWLVDELAEHTKNLNEWHRATWRTCPNNEVPHRHMSDDCERIPSNSSLGDDFIVKTPLCTTYTADRDMGWYKDNLEQTALQDYETALAEYKRLIASAEQFYQCIGQLYIQSRQTYAPAETIQALRDACSHKELVLHNLKETRQTAVERAGHCKRQLDAGDLCKPEWLESQWRKLIKAYTPADNQYPGLSTITPPAIVGDTPRPELRPVVGQKSGEIRQGGARNIPVVAPAGGRTNPVRRQAITHNLPIAVVPAKQAKQQGGAPLSRKADSITAEPFPVYREEVSGPADHAGVNSPFARMQIPQAVAGADKVSDLAAEIKNVNLGPHMVPQLARTKRATTPLSSLVSPEEWRGTMERDETDGDEDSDEDEPVTLSRPRPITISRPRAATGVSRRDLSVQDNDSELESSKSETEVEAEVHHR